jgi:protein-tyrosine phosphatase
MQAAKPGLWISITQISVQLALNMQPVNRKTELFQIFAKHARRWSPVLHAWTKIFLIRIAVRTGCKKSGRFRMQPSGFSVANERTSNFEMTKKVLFICTGNYYRSRFAELLFSALASQKNLDWNSDSRGLALGISNVGPVYPGVLDRLKALGYPAQTESRFPVRLEMADLETADLIIAINESEHRPLMSQRFGQWADRASYWDVPDLNLMNAGTAFSQIEKHVTSLIHDLQNQHSS